MENQVCKTREIFKNNLINLRGTKSAYQVSKESGISFSYLRGMETGEKKTPSFEMMEKIAEYYGVTVPDLLKENTENIFRKEVNMKGDKHTEVKVYKNHQTKIVYTYYILADRFLTMEERNEISQMDEAEFLELAKKNCWQVHRMSK